MCAPRRNPVRQTLASSPAARTTHMHVLGASGRGKSYFLEHLIRQDIHER